jgi:hypothetical protein
VRDLARVIHDAFDYEAGVTRADSPIDDVLKHGKGVCQDFAHLMIATCRSWGIPARYVSGYLFTDRSVGDRSDPDASHAWVEVFLPSLRWVGFDPTNNTVAGERHVVCAIGRDYSDVPPSRGVYKGEAESQLGVGVSVRRARAALAEPEFLRLAVGDAVGRQDHAAGGEAAAGDHALEAVGLADEAADEGRDRLVVHLGRRADLLDAALVEDGHAVGQVEGLFLVVGDEDGGHARGVMHAAQFLAQRLADRGVQRAEGLVQQQHAGLHGQGARQGHALALAAGQLRGIALAQAVQLDQRNRSSTRLVISALDGLSLPLRTSRPNAMFLATVMCLNSAYCWNTKPTRRAAAEAKVTS